MEVDANGNLEMNSIRKGISNAAFSASDNGEKGDPVNKKKGRCKIPAGSQGEPRGQAAHSDRSKGKTPKDSTDDPLQKNDPWLKAQTSIPTSFASHQAFLRKEREREESKPKNEEGSKIGNHQPRQETPSAMEVEPPWWQNTPRPYSEGPEAEGKTGKGKTAERRREPSMRDGGSDGG